jgi:hypothetical protein
MEMALHSDRIVPGCLGLLEIPSMLCYMCVYVLRKEILCCFGKIRFEVEGFCLFYFGFLLVFFRFVKGDGCGYIL